MTETFTSAAFGSVLSQRMQSWGRLSLALPPGSGSAVERGEWDAPRGADRVGEPPRGGRLSPAPSGPHRALALDSGGSPVRISPLAMLQEIVGGRGIAVSHDTLWRFLAAAGSVSKKDTGRRRA